IGDFDRKIAEVFRKHPDRRIFESSPERERLWRRGYRRHLARIGIAFRTPRKSRNSPARLPLPTRAVKKSGCIGGGRVRNLCAKAFRNLPSIHDDGVVGRGYITNCKSSGGKVTTPRYERWLTSGSELCSGAGKITCPTTMRSIANHW